MKGTVALMAGLFLIGLTACGSDGDAPVVAIVANAPFTIEIDEMLGELAALGWDDVEVVRSDAPSPETLDAQIAAAESGEADLVVTYSTIAAQRVAAAEGLADTSHVFSALNDPVGAGVVADLAVPGALATGIGGGKVSEQAMEVFAGATGATRVIVAHAPDDPGSGASLAGFEVSAARLGIELLIATVSDDEPFSSSLAAAGPGDLVVLTASGVVGARADEIVAAATARDIPVANAAGNAGGTDGLVMSSTIDSVERGRRTAAIVADVLGGFDPGSIPVRPPPTQLVVDITAASGFGISIPPAVLVLADEVRGDAS